MPAHCFQFGHLPPGLQSDRRETALWALNEVENNVGIGGQKIFLAQLCLAALDRRQSHAGRRRFATSSAR